MNIRAKFEEIWPVPDGLQWNERAGEYRVRTFYNAWGTICNERNARLDTFTRCQETMAPVMALVDELVKEVEDAYSAYGVMPECVDRAKQIMEHKK
jgi:hypothetical protein